MKSVSHRARKQASERMGKNDRETESCVCDSVQCGRKILLLQSAH